MKIIRVENYQEQNLLLNKNNISEYLSGNEEVLSGAPTTTTTEAPTTTTTTTAPTTTTTPAPEIFGRIAADGGENTAEIGPTGTRFKIRRIWQLESNTNLPVGYREETDLL